MSWSVFLLSHPWLTTTNPSYSFPLLKTSATALCGTTGMNWYLCRLCPESQGTLARWRWSHIWPPGVRSASKVHYNISATTRGCGGQVVQILPSAKYRTLFRFSHLEVLQLKSRFLNVSWHYNGIEGLANLGANSALGGSTHTHSINR